MIRPHYHHTNISGFSGILHYNSVVVWEGYQQHRIVLSKLLLAGMLASVFHSSSTTIAM